MEMNPDRHSPIFFRRPPVFPFYLLDCVFFFPYTLFIKKEFIITWMSTTTNSDCQNIITKILSK